MSATGADAAAARRVQIEGSGAVGQGARSELSSILDGLATFSAGKWPDVGRATSRWETATEAFMHSIDWRRGLFGLWLTASIVWLVGAGFVMQKDIRRDVSTRMSAELRPDTDSAHWTQLNAPGLGYGEWIYQFEPGYAARDAAQGNVISAASVLLLPSLFLFALGWAGIWTWRGIRSYRTISQPVTVSSSGSADRWPRSHTHMDPDLENVIRQALGVARAAGRDEGSLFRPNS
jgi:hypothetical protein